MNGGSAGQAGRVAGDVREERGRSGARAHRARLQQQVALPQSCLEGRAALIALGAFSEWDASLPRSSGIHHVDNSLGPCNMTRRLLSLSEALDRADEACLPAADKLLVELAECGRGDDGPLVQKGLLARRCARPSRLVLHQRYQGAQHYRTEPAASIWLAEFILVLLIFVAV